VSDRVSQYVLLCEDDMQETLVRTYLKQCGVLSHDIVLRNADGSKHGGIGWVLRQFPAELNTCRQRHKRAKTCLIVMADGDDLAVADREREFQDEAAFTAADPLVVLLPKRHVETWVCAATGRSVTEAEDCKKYRLERSDIREAARQIHTWARSELPDDSTCVPSLWAALPRWRRIG